MKKRNKFILVVVVSVFLYLSFIIYSDIENVIDAFDAFNWILLPVILSLVFTGYLLRASRWHYYLKRINVSVSRRESYLIFLAGQSMAITPGKIGELIKPYLLEKRKGTRVDATIPVVFIERLTDLIGMILLATLGLMSIRYGLTPLFITVILVVTTIFILQYKPFCLKMIKKMEKIPKLGKYAENFETAYDTTYSLLNPKPLGLATLISFCAWGLECICMYLVFAGLGVEVGFFEAVFIFAFSSIIGALTMLPGGLGTAEGSMVGLTVMLGVDISQATAATLIIRFSTLWFGVIIGLVILQYLSRDGEESGGRGNKRR